MKKTYVALLTMLGSFLLQWIAGDLPAGRTVFLPLAALAFCVWSWHLGFEARLWFALVIGFIMDTAGLAPFGTSILACLAAAYACEIFRSFFSNTDSRVTWSIGAALMVLVFLSTSPLFNLLVK